jgi:hypothetical protein
VSVAKTTPASADAGGAAVMLPRIESRILVVRDQKIIIDADLALLYGVPTKALNQAVKRNAERFPMDFMFQLSPPEKAEVVTSCDHLSKLKFSKSLPYAFTEHGAIQAANVLASSRAVEMGIYVVRAFVRLKAASASYAELTKRLTELDEKTEGIAMAHDTFSRNARTQLRQLIEAVNQLMAPPDPPKRPIGFINPEDKGKQTSGSRRGSN